MKKSTQRKAARKKSARRKTSKKRGPKKAAMRTAASKRRHAVETASRRGSGIDSDLRNAAITSALRRLGK